MASKNDMTQILGLLLIVVIALGLTPTIVASCADAQWGNSNTEYMMQTIGGTNVTAALAYPARYSLTNEYFTLVIVAGGTGSEVKSGGASVPRSNYTYSNSTYKITYAGGATGPWNPALSYNVSITYSYALDSAPFALLGLVPLFWVVLIIASVVVVVTKKLKMW